MKKNKDFLTQIFEYAETMPNHIALVDEAHKITYRELKFRVEKTVKKIESLSIQDKCVVLQLPRGIYFPIMVLSLSKLSITFVPQDISQPKERLDQMIDTAEASVVISLDSEGEYQFKKISQTVSNSSNAWAIYFTSGSTSIPKAVEIPRDNVMNTVLWEQERFKITPNDHVAVYTPYSFAISYIELFSSLYSGATIYIANEVIRHDLGMLEKFLIKNEISLMNTTAVIGERIMKTMTVPSLRLLTLSGQRFPRVNLKEINYQVFNVYGNTECGAATITEINNLDKKITIGKPVLNMGALVLGEENQVLPSGNIGELFIYGPQVAIGYYKNIDATDKTFVTIITLDGEKIRGYKTGDFARILLNGEIDYLGRRDSQYKINGVRIDLTEIEEAVRDAVTSVEQVHIAVKDNSIYCWLISDHPEIESNVVEKLSKRLPLVMIPTRIIQIESFPLNGNGKTDEKQLFKDLFNQSNTVDERAISEEQRAAEQYLKNAWAQLLNINAEKIGFDNDFKKLGATSLQIMELGVKIFQDLNKKVNFVELHRQSKLCDMAKILITEDKFRAIYTFVERTPEMGDNPALFVVHSGNTGSDVYRPLFEKNRKANFPIYVIEPHNLLTSGKRISGIENTASYYVDLIENFTSEKNIKLINLMGWSYGGVVASEMCYQFLNDDTLKNVNELAILDSPFYLDETDIDLADFREKSGYFRKYFEETHIFEGMSKKNITTEKLIRNNHLVFQDLINYQPKKIVTRTIFVRSMVEEKPLTDCQIRKLFSNCNIVDVFSKHDYLFIEQKTCNTIKDLLHLVPEFVVSK